MGQAESGKTVTAVVEERRVGSAVGEDVAAGHERILLSEQQFANVDFRVVQKVQKGGPSNSL